ncbi:MAG TPA: serine/threonine-protein kinase [Gammaproteobacteria bacterium]|nr:serine/threonine-protein kinase [Gammaproteobacteria bacterium]
MKKRFWASDWFAGLVYALLFLIANVVAFRAFDAIERAAYDMGVGSVDATPSDRIAVIGIDEKSIANIGRWPWSRELHASMIDKLAAAGAKVVGLTIFFSEPQQDPGLQHIQHLLSFYDGSSLARYVPPPAEETADGVTPAASPPSSALPADLRTDLAELRGRLGAANTALDTDARLGRAMQQAGNVVVPMLFTAGTPIGRPDAEIPEFVLRNALFDVEPGEAGALPPLTTIELIPPVPAIGSGAARIGHLITLLDSDGGYRREPLVVQYYDTYFPSFSLAVAAQSLNLKPEDIQVKLGEGVKLGGLFIGTDPELNMYNFYYSASGGSAFQVDSFFDVWTDVIPAAKYRDKIVLIGPTAPGIGDTMATPIDPAMPPVLASAHIISSILQEDFFTQPGWAGGIRFGTFLLLTLYIMFLLPRLGAGTAALASLGLGTALVVTEFSLMSAKAVWLPLMTPVLYLLAGHLLITIKRFNVTEKLKLRTEAESAESNKMLGLAFQGQGQLDMAFEKFRKLPLDDAVMDLLYNLALDYERKRQHNKAGSVYSYMAQYDPNFRDIQTRLKRAKQLEETVIIGGAGATAAGTLILNAEGDVQKPMLGRYQVEKELGKGAMGVVYLGRDPKINRVVAIKTMALSQEFEADELEDVKARFFREAETAGRLNHPNIVTIYDAGEEHDLAYIAMEFLKGKDLTKHVKPQSLLPAAKVFKIIADAADALDYAHQNGVVHRDIKPANLMYEEDTGNLKITDFGIARITDSSKTKTGMVLGTPSYMSPEQLSGKKVDGRSDLFSLGVTFYQLLTAQLPFQADSMATLMFKIANDPHAPVTILRPDLPPCIDAIIDKALAKDIEQRYQRGADMARDIRACAANLAP